MQIKVYVVSDKIKSFYQSAIDEYSKRLSRYCKIKLVYCKNEKSLQNKMNDKEYIINISYHPSNISSLELSEKLNQLMVSGHSNISFIIGASSIVSNETLSISGMDMETDLLLTIIYEQIYRAYRIMHNHPYHK